MTSLWAYLPPPITFGHFLAYPHPLPQKWPTVLGVTFGLLNRPTPLPPNHFWSLFGLPPPSPKSDIIYGQSLIQWKSQVSNTISICLTVEIRRQVQSWSTVSVKKVDKNTQLQRSKNQSILTRNIQSREENTCCTAWDGSLSTILYHERKSSRKEYTTRIAALSGMYRW